MWDFLFIVLYIYDMKCFDFMVSVGLSSIFYVYKLKKQVIAFPLYVNTLSIILRQKFLTWNESLNNYLLDQQNRNFKSKRIYKKVLWHTIIVSNWIPNWESLPKKLAFKNGLECEGFDSLMEAFVAYEQGS